MTFHVPEKARLTTGPLATDFTYGQNGAFRIPSPEPGWTLFLICADGTDAEPTEPDAENWEHVSVRAAASATKSRVPNWREMCHVKDLCWDEDDIVIQLHPKKSDYVNQHPHVLHLWRCKNREVPMPPRSCV